MLRETGKRMTFCGILVVTAAFSLVAWSPAEAVDVRPSRSSPGLSASTTPQPIKPTEARCGATSSARRQTRKTC